jgi:hypothetical protein
MRKDRISIEDGVARIATKRGDILMDASDVVVLDGRSLHLKKRRRGQECWDARLESYSKPRKRVYLSRAIMQPLPGLEVDHVNHNTLDNRRCNLRVCTRSENRRNGRKQSQTKWRFKGIFYHGHGTYSGERGGKGRWRAYTRVSGKRIWLGYYQTDIEAAMAYNRYVAAEFGKFACFNRFDSCPLLLNEADLFGGRLGSSRRDGRQSGRGFTTLG